MYYYYTTLKCRAMKRLKMFDISFPFSLFFVFINKVYMYISKVYNV